MTDNRMCDKKSVKEVDEDENWSSESSVSEETDNLETEDTDDSKSNDTDESDSKSSENSIQLFKDAADPEKTKMIFGKSTKSKENTILYLTDYFVKVGDQQMCISCSKNKFVPNSSDNMRKHLYQYHSND